MNRKPKWYILVFQHAVLVIAALIALYPIWFAILASFRDTGRLYSLSLPGMFLPTDFSLENYRVMIFDKPFPTWILNSAFVSAATTILSLVIVTSAAFAFSRFRFKGREFILIFLLGIQAFPGILSLVAVALVLSAIGLYNSHFGLMLAYATSTIVFSTWNLKGYFDTLPHELEEAAMIDGASPIQSFLLIALPLARPALAITALFAFLAAWGDFVFANVLVTSDSKKMAVPAMYALANSMSPPWGQFAAGFVIVIIPTMIVFLAMQRYLESGLTLGGVKG